MLYLKFPAVDKIESFVTLNSVVKIVYQIIHFFSTRKAYLYSIYISLPVFKNYLRSYKMAPSLLLHSCLTFSIVEKRV